MSEKDRREEREMVRPQKGGQSQKNLLVALSDCTREGNAGKENILCWWTWLCPAPLQQGGDRSTAPSRGRFYYLQEDAKLGFSSFVSLRFELRPSGLAASPATHWFISPIPEFYIRRPTLNVGGAVPWSWRKWEEYSRTYLPLISVLGCGRNQLSQLCHCDFPLWWALLGTVI